MSNSENTFDKANDKKKPKNPTTIILGDDKDLDTIIDEDVISDDSSDKSVDDTYCHLDNFGFSLENSDIMSVPAII